MTGTSKVFVCTGDGTIRTFKEEGVAGSVPVKDRDFTYSGNCEVIDDSNDVDGTQWRIKFKTSGILTFTTEQLVDVFIVNGGKAGSAGSVADSPSYLGNGGDGGLGGGTGTFKNVTITPVIENTITIAGAAGGSSALGKHVSTLLTTGAIGKGGYNYVEDGYAKFSPATSGTGGVAEFGDPAATYYAGGGGGGASAKRPTSSPIRGASGSNGGGKGGSSGYETSGSGSNAICVAATAGSSGTANTGGGGGGGGGGSYGKRGNIAGRGGSGGSGIVIIRKHKE